jgi:hypothetical protein
LTGELDVAEATKMMVEVTLEAATVVVAMMVEAALKLLLSAVDMADEEGGATAVFEVEVWDTVLVVGDTVLVVGNTVLVVGDTVLAVC